MNRRSSAAVIIRKTAGLSVTTLIHNFYLVRRPAQLELRVTNRLRTASP